MSVHARLGVLSLLLACASGCRYCARDVACVDDSNCPSTLRLCEAGRCTVPAGGGFVIPPPRPPRIDLVDGDGSARAPSTTAGAPVNATAAGHRLRAALVVHGVNLDAVTSATLASAGAPAALTIDSVSATGDQMRILLPTNLAAGAFTLVLAAGSSEARADVFLLQGEPGPTSLVEPRAPSSCPSGGVGLAFGVDANGNGVLDASEENASLARDLCNGSNGAGDAAFDCSSGTCTATLPVAVPALAIAGQAAAVHIDAPVTVLVPQEAPTIAAAIALFDGIALDADVDIVLGAGTFEEPARIVVTRVDGLHFHISGAGVNTTTVHFTGTDGFLAADGGRIGNIGLLTIAGNDTPGTTGVFAVRGGEVTIAPGVDLQHFTTCASATLGGILVAQSVIAQQCETGFLASEFGAIEAPSATATSGQFGFIAEIGSVIDATHCTATSDTTEGVDAAAGSAVIATNCAFVADGTGARSESGSFAFVAGSSFNNVTLGLDALGNSGLEDTGTTTSSQTDASSIITP